jgi:Ca2+/Na+ antiporter
VFSNAIHTSLLEKRIAELKELEAQQMAELKALAGTIADSVSPVGIIRSTLKDIAVSPDFRSNVINTAIGLGAGFLGRKLYVGNSKNIFRKITGSAVQFVLANFIRKKIPQIQENQLPREL